MTTGPMPLGIRKHFSGEDDLPTNRVYRSGVRFDCPECGKLLKDDPLHATKLEKGCLACGGDLRLVAKGEDTLVGGAIWFRCLKCKALFIKRRGELLPNQGRSGFKEYTEF